MHELMADAGRADAADASTAAVAGDSVATAPLRRRRPAPAPPPPPAARRAVRSTQFIPPAGVTAAPRADGGAERGREEARRGAPLRAPARLGDQALQRGESRGRAARTSDLYERLKEDIDRSRQMYDERIADDVRKSSNYFYDELVRILADGNAEVLGL